MKTYYIAAPLPIDSERNYLESKFNSELKIHPKNNQIGIITTNLERDEVMTVLDNAEVELIIVDDLKDWVNE